MISFEAVDKNYPDPQGGVIQAVCGLTLQIHEGETHCLIGNSGCGKTTTLRLINRLEEPSRGRVLVDDEDVAAADVITLRRRLGYVVQSGGLFPHMTVARNVGILCALEGWSAGDVQARTAELLQLVGLPQAEFGARYPGELSGGQQQRVGVARALALDPTIVLMDEPFGALDPITRRDLQREFRELLTRVRKTVVLVTHDLGEAFALGDRVSIMRDGHLLQTGSERELTETPANDYVREFLAGHAGGRA